MGKVDFHSMKKAWENIKNSHYGFLKYFGCSRSPHNSQNMGNVNSHNTGKVCEKNKHLKVMGFSDILGEAEIHKIPKT